MVASAQVPVAAPDPSTLMSAAWLGRLFYVTGELARGQVVLAARTQGGNDRMRKLLQRRHAFGEEAHA
jgi:hypothetical protein